MVLLLLPLQGAPAEVSAITSKHGLKYAGEGMSALVAIAHAAKDRSLEVGLCGYVYVIEINGGLVLNG